MRNLLIIVLTCLTIECYGQQLIKKKFFSKTISDTVKYSVWLPRDWSKNKKYLGIYMNSYGALRNNAMLVAANIFNYINNFPDCVVIEIESGNISNMDYDYVTSKVNDKGEQFISVLKTELFPIIEGEFNTSGFRTFVGHSYSSTYGNYLLFTYPKLFNSYILFAPERLEETIGSVEISNKLIEFIRKNHISYFLSVAGTDLPRRKAYGEDIRNKLATIEDPNFRFKMKVYGEADHNDIISWGLLDALKFIFEDYLIKPDSENIEDVGLWFHKKKEKILEIYGIPVQKNSNIQSTLLTLAAKQKNSVAMDSLAKYFQSDSSTQNSLMLFNTAYTYLNDFNNIKCATEYFLRSIRSANEANKPSEAFRAYYRLSKDLLWGQQGDLEGAWKLMEEAYLKTNSSIAKYQMGWLASESGQRTDQGIKALKYFLENQISTMPEKIAFSEESANLLLAKCYYKNNDLKNAKHYLSKSISKNPKFQPALKWKFEIKF